MSSPMLTGRVAKAGAFRCLLLGRRTSDCSLKWLLPVRFCMGISPEGLMQVGIDSMDGKVGGSAGN